MEHEYLQNIHSEDWLELDLPVRFIGGKKLKVKNKNKKRQKHGGTLKTNFYLLLM